MILLRICNQASIAWQISQWSAPGSNDDVGVLTSPDAGATLNIVHNSVLPEKSSQLLHSVARGRGAVGV